jgi:hypothetical protein
MSATKRPRFFFGILIFCGLAFSSIDARAATVDASSCSMADVQAAMDAAIDGDTIAIPACGCGDAPPWPDRIVISKSVVIQGQGVSNTCIREYAFATLVGVNDWRITGIRFQQETEGTTQPIIVGEPNQHGGTPITGWSIDGNAFYGYLAPFSVWNGSTGLIANNYLEFTDGSGPNEGVYIYGRNDADWTTPEFFGTANQYVVVEDNLFYCKGMRCSHAICAGWGGSYVFRCNRIESESSTFKWNDAVDAHGYGHGTGIRSVRQYEVYGNLFVSKGSESRAMNLRGGSGRIFANRWDKTGRYTQCTPECVIAFTDYRLFSTDLSMAYPTDINDCATNSANWPAADQANACPSNEGYPCCDQIGRGQDGAGGLRQASSPVFLWDNRDLSGNDQGVRAAPVENVPEYILLDREFFVGEIPGGYEPYVYPHPSRGLAVTLTCLTDDHSNAKTGITFFSSLPDTEDDSLEPFPDAPADGAGEQAEDGFPDAAADTAMDGVPDGAVPPDGEDERVDGNGEAGSGCSCTIP